MSKTVHDVELELAMAEAEHHRRCRSIDRRHSMFKALTILAALFPILCIAFAAAGQHADEPDCPDLWRMTAEDAVEEWARLYLAGSMCADDYGNQDGKLEPVDYSSFIQRANVEWRGPDDPSKPDWWPVGAREYETGSLGLAACIEALDGVGGVLVLSNQADADAFVDRLNSGSLSGASEERRLVVRAEPGVRLRLPVAMRNNQNLLNHVVFYGLRSEPDGHDNSDAFHLRGNHRDVGFVGCTVTEWSGGIVGGSGGDEDDRFDHRPSGVWIDSCKITRIFHSGAPVQTPENWRSKTYKAQAVYFGSVDGLSIRETQFIDNGWDNVKYPNRETASVFNQNLYLGQAAENVSVEWCIFDGAANNAIVCKGRRVSIKHNEFRRVVNAVSMGTDESPEFPFSGEIMYNVGHDFVANNPLDDPSLPGGRQMDSTSGVALAFLHVDGVVVSGNVWDRTPVPGAVSPRKSTAYYFFNHKNDLPMKGVLIVDDELVGFEQLAEMRDYARPAHQDVQMLGVTGAVNMDLLVRNTEPKGKIDAAAGFRLDGEPMGVR